MNEGKLYLRFDDISEPFNAINMTERFLMDVKREPYIWKWVIISAHNALQGFMVLALKGTGNFQVVKWKKEYEGKSQYEILSDPNKKLCDFIDLFKKIKNERYLGENYFKDKSGDITSSIKTINIWRNQFIHYFPTKWSIQIMYLIQILTDTFKVVSFLINHNEVTRYYNEDQISEIKRAISNCNSILSTIEY